MKEIIEFIKECDIDDILVFPVFTILISILWLLAFAIGCR